MGRISLMIYHQIGYLSTFLFNKVYLFSVCTCIALFVGSYVVRYVYIPCLRLEYATQLMYLDY